MKGYQIDEFDATIPLPAEVRVAMDDIAVTLREGLLAMAVGAGLSVMQTLMAESVTSTVVRRPQVGGPASRR